MKQTALIIGLAVLQFWALGAYQEYPQEAVIAALTVLVVALITRLN